MDSRIKHILAAASGIFCLIVYLITLHPGVAFVDSGELAAVSYTFGVPHPTGYPLFVLIGYCVSHIPLWGSVIYRLNLLSAIESSAAVVITFYSVLFMLKSLNVFAVKKTLKKEKNNSKILNSQPGSENINLLVLSFIAAVLSGLTKTFWFNATQTEVYSLHSLFISLLFYSILKIYFSFKDFQRKYWAYLFLLLGLSAANHSTTVYFIPPVLLLIYFQFKVNKKALMKVLTSALFVIPGLLLYLVLVFTALQKPYLNWSDPQNLSNLLYHIRGSDFSQLMFSSSSTFSGNAGRFFSDLISETAVLTGLTGIAGIIYLLKKGKKLFYIVLFLITVCLLNSFNYSTVELTSFYLVVHYLIAFFVSMGLAYILFKFPGKIPLTGNKIKPELVIIGIVLFAFSIGFNFKENNNSSNFVNEDITVNTLNVLDKDAVLITYDYSYIYSSSLYYQLVEKLRTDVKVFNIKFISVPWYLQSIKKYYPEVYSSFQTAADEYIVKYNLDDPAHPIRLTGLVKAFIEGIIAHYPLYLTVDFVLSREMSNFIAAYTLQPDGLIYSLKEKNSPYDPESGSASLNAVLRKFEPAGAHKKRVYVSIPGVLFETAYYHYKNKNYSASVKFLDKSLELNPEFADAINLKNKVINEKSK